jgi:hypothetical protein
MGWAETAREERLARIGEYRPERYRVTVYDTFEQERLRFAAASIRNGMTVPEFFLYCAEYVLDHHRKLRTVRAVFRKGAREVCSAVRAGANRRDAVEAFSGRAWQLVAAEIRSREAGR